MLPPLAWLLASAPLAAAVVFHGAGQQGRLLERGAARGTLAARFPFYHTSEQLQAEVRRLERTCGGALSVHVVEDNGTSIEAVRVSRPRAPGSPPPVNRVLLITGEHSRELIGPEAALHLVRALCGDVALRGGRRAAEALETSEFQLVLNSNPWSRAKVEGGQFCERLNPSGVDLNRNWGARWTSAWTLGSSPGPSPFSEPETRLLRRLAEEYKPTAFLSVHSGTRGLYMPWAYARHTSASENQQAMLRVLRAVDEKHCRCPYGAAGQQVGYACPGTSLDWAYANLGAPYSFAFEIWGGRSQRLRQRWEQSLLHGGASLLQLGQQLSHPHFSGVFERHPSDFVLPNVTSLGGGWTLPSGGLGWLSMLHGDAKLMTCFRYFNPDSQEVYDEVVDNWAQAFLDTAELVAADLKRKGASNPAVPA